MCANILMLVALFFTAAVPGFACGQCGTFTTMGFLWFVTFPAIFCLALVAMLQFWLFKDRPGKKLAASAAVLFIFPYVSYDLAWILILSVCLYQIGRQVRIFVKHD